MPMYDEEYTPPPSEKELAHKALQDHYKGFLKRENLLEDLETLETEHAKRVQEFYSKEWDDEAARLYAQEELVEEQKTLTKTRAIIEQLVRASEGNAYGRNDK